ncbi:MAG: hypothetical protein H6839_00155 [Planctomycetes bacterium]|nr:hypothetical protein [Planctomycetota bacterium]
MLRYLIALCLCAGALSAQDNHYWTHQFGTRASLMGGALIGGVDDTSAVYYNPGRLGWISNDSLKVSANGYQLATLTVKDGVGKGKDFTSTQGDIVPLSASGVFLFGQPGLALGFHILARQFSDVSASARREARFNVIDDARSAGDEDYIGAFQFDSSTEEYWAGLGFGWAPTDWLSLGVTHFGCLRFEEQNYDITTRAVGAGSATFGADNIAGFDVWNVRMLWKFGVAAEFGGLRMGLTVTTQSLNLFGGATVRRQITVDDLDIDGDGSGNDFEANDRRDGVSTRYRSPWSFGTGVDYDFGPVVLAVAAEWFLPVGKYAVVSPNGDKAFFLGGVSTESSRELLTVYDGKRGAFNFSIGLQTEFGKDWQGYWSMRRDAAADYVDWDEKVHFGISTWDLFHFATGVAFTTRQDDGNPKHELMIGLQFSLGNGRTTQPVNFDTPREDLLLTGRTRRTDISYFAISLIVGYTYYF